MQGSRPELHHPAPVAPRKANINIKALKNIQLLVLNRISGERQTVDFTAGSEKIVDRFKITVASCQKRVVDKVNHYTAVSFSVFDQKKQKIHL